MFAAFILFYLTCAGCLALVVQLLCNVVNISNDNDVFCSNDVIFAAFFVFAYYCCRFCYIRALTGEKNEVRIP